MRLQARTKRSAFTLIELIIVITIISVIAALTIGAIAKSFNWVNQKNTEQTMQKVLLRLQRVIDRLYKEADDWPAVTEARILDQANGSFERARLIKVLYLYKWTFPTCYAEVFHNVQESRMLYEPNGYPPARALLAKLRSNYSAIPDPFNPLVPATASWVAATPTTIADIAQDIPWQNSACLLAAYTYANGSPDDFTSNEVIVRALPVGIGGNNADLNPKLVDAWGTPLFYLRHGNFACSRHRFGGVGGLARPAFYMGLVKPAALASLDFAPLEYILNPSNTTPSKLPPQDWYYTSFYLQQLQQRSLTSYRALLGKDPFDPTGLIKGINNNNQWRTAAASTGDWLVPNFPTVNDVAWLSPPLAGGQHGLWFRSTFGYSPENTDRTISEPGNPANTVTLLQPFSPMVILSAGGDKLFNQWDDNLDSYRLQINVSGQQ